MMTSGLTAKPPEPPMPASVEKPAATATKSETDFATLLQNSNRAEQLQRDKDTQALGDGKELKVGEAKNDRELREMLEKLTGRKQDKLKNKLEKDDYLNLMVTQLKYQDPTKPMEQQEMATQLAQFNTVEQIMNTNKLLGEMKSNQGQANVDSLSGYLGKTIEVQGNQVSPGSLESSRVDFSLSVGAGSVSAQIKDEQGTVVRSLALGQKDAGNHSVQWDGRDDKGQNLKGKSYTLELSATSADGKPITVNSSYLAEVTGISDLSKGGKLETTRGTIETQKVVALRKPSSTVASASLPSAVPPSSVSPSSAVQNIVPDKVTNKQASVPV